MIKAIRARTLGDALNALSGEIAEKENRGEENLVFCEDRLTLLAERAVLAGSGGTFFSEVTTFARYLQTEGPVLSKEGSVMKISELILKHGKEGCFTGGSARAVYETLAQLSASRVSAEMLQRAAEETEGVLQRKTKELARLAGEYEEFLRENGLTDENGYLALLPDKIAEGNGEKNLFFFAFPSFTKQALLGVRAALDGARSVTGIFLGGRESVYTSNALNAFVRTAEECGYSCTVEDAPTSLQEEAKLLLEGLFLPVTEEPARTEKLCVFEEEDETEEMLTIASLIKRHIAAGARYRDIAVLVPGKEYFLTAEKALSSYKIPFYLERKRPLSEHPFAGYVLDILDGVADGVLPEEADAIASSVCFGEADVYRNYLARYGCYRGAAKKEIREEGELNGFSRGELLPFAERMKKISELFPKRGTGRTYVNAVRELFLLSDWQSVFDGLKADAGEVGGFSPAEEDFLSIGIGQEEPFGKTLDEIERVAGEREFRVREFAALLKSGLEANEVLLIPPSLDSVFVGDATESRIPPVKILFAAGLTESLPRVSEDTAVIRDGEMKRLGEIKVEIEPAIRDVNLRFRESFALNLASFTERLYLSRPVKLHGEETGRSEALLFVRRRFQTLPLPELFPYDCSERAPAFLRMIREKERFGNGEAGEDGLNVRRFNAIRSALEEEGALPVERGKEEKSPLARALWMKNERVSPTLLEEYFECPYMGFMKRAVGLSERKEGGADGADAGVFVHTVLERAAKKFNAVRDGEALKAEVLGIAEELLQEPRFSFLADTAEGGYLKEKLTSDCLLATAAAWEQLVRSGFRVREAEEELTLPALRIAGKADRVDETDSLVRVIDYKTGYFDDSPVAYYTGRRLQLELYLLASAAGKTPAGAFYFPAADVFRREGEERYQMKGFYCSDAESGEGDRGDARGMGGEDFSDFLQYACLVAEGAEREMEEGNIAPSPYEGACDRCRMRSLCAYTGEGRKEPECSGVEISSVVRERRKS